VTQQSKVNQKNPSIVNSNRFVVLKVIEEPGKDSLEADPMIIPSKPKDREVASKVPDSQHK